MSQNDFTIANQGFPAFRADLNSALQALASNNSGATEPSTMFANMWWYDSANNIMYIRNEDNDAWIKFAELDQANDKFVLSGTLQLDDGTVSAPALTFNSDTNMGIYRGGTDILKFVTAGTDAITIDASQNTTFAGTVVSDGMSTNTAGTSNFIAGVSAGSLIGSGANYNTFVGDRAGRVCSSGDNNVAIGFEALDSEIGGGASVAVGYQALLDQNTSSTNYNTAVGFRSGKSITTGVENTIIGGLAGDSLTTGHENTAVGLASLGGDTQGKKSVAVGWGTLTNQNFTSATDVYNIAIGYAAGNDITTGIQNTIIGSLAGDALTDADYNTAIGHQALTSDTKGARSVAVGYNSLRNQNFTSIVETFNTAVGFGSGQSVSTGQYNTLIGANAGDALTDADYNVAIGFGSLSNDAQGSRSVAIGYNALASQNFTSATESKNTAVGMFAGDTVSTGTNNVFVGYNSGGDVTTGSKNTILGSYTGNQSGLDIRTSSNNIVLSDGDGNPRGIFDSSGNFMVGTTDNELFDNTSGGGLCYRPSLSLDIAREATSSSNSMLTLNNTGVDAEFIDFRKDATTVGSIATEGGDLTIGTGDTRLKFIDGSDTINPTNASNSGRDNAINLGSSFHRFKDLYLSGGVYLGGTSSLHKLDDYEEGTWIPALEDYGGTPTFADARFTKIGRVVHASVKVSLDGSSDPSGFKISGLPFTSLNTTNSIFGGYISYTSSTFTNNIYVFVNSNDTDIRLYTTSGNSVSYNDIGASKEIRLVAIYFTA